MISAAANRVTKLSGRCHNKKGGKNTRPEGRTNCRRTRLPMKKRAATKAAYIKRRQPARKPPSCKKILEGRPPEGGGVSGGAVEESGKGSMANYHLGERLMPVSTSDVLCGAP